MENGHRLFRLCWWGANVLLGAALMTLIYAGGWEFSVRQYLRGFSDAVVPATATSEQKAEAILAWMRNGRGAIDEFALFLLS